MPEATANSILIWGLNWVSFKRFETNLRLWQKILNLNTNSSMKTLNWMIWQKIGYILRACTMTLLNVPYIYLDSRMKKKSRTNHFSKLFIHLLFQSQFSHFNFLCLKTSSMTLKSNFWKILYPQRSYSKDFWQMNRRKIFPLTLLYQSM